jgi:hypothetical protein
MDPTAPSQRITSIRGIRSTLQKQYEVELKARSNTEALSAQNKWASWTQIVAAARWLCDDFRSLLKVYRREQAGKDGEWSPALLGAGGDLVPLSRRVAAAAQDALCVLLYTVIPPARGLEYSTLQWSLDPNEVPKVGRENLLCVGASGGATLKLSSFKTVKNMGCQSVPLPSDPSLQSALDVCQELRATLLRGKRHANVFSRHSDGAALTGSGAWSVYLTNVFGRGLEGSRITTLKDHDAIINTRANMRVSVNSLRKGVFVNFVSMHVSVLTT